ncbi:hypothetical protein [Oceanipulchritudo coccoides]|uniref:hypothetical protein n=1 Tax=Oceanipulchritudo coccoides TaxID=2706888 RepID=UPI001EE8C62E|nr:hypothetical protein [Oceanipulchritudo coccoides]
MRLEYTFEQQKSIKEEISKSKTPLLQATENLNYRLWNLLSHRNEDWLYRTPEEWNKPPHHYIRSFAYKWISLIYWILKAEKSVGGYDATLSTEEDLLYLKYVKAIKFCLCDRLLIQSLGYVSTDTTNHFYIDDLSRFSDFIHSDSDVVAFHKFEEKIKNDIKPVAKVFQFLSQTRNESNNKSMNMLWALHLIIISFLNDFGHEFQRTDSKKILKLVKEDYSDFAISTEFKRFLERHRLVDNMKLITKNLA